MRLLPVIFALILIPPAASPGQDASTILPPSPKTGDKSHPLAAKIRDFLARQGKFAPFKSTALRRGDYLDVIARQVKAMQTYQRADGRIIDPVEKIEKYYTTPCYAHCVAALAAGGYCKDDEGKKLLSSGMKAMDVAVADMAGGKAAGGHGDFFTWPVMLAFELFAKTAPAQRVEGWRKALARIDRRKLYHAGPNSANWNIVNLCGEFLRVSSGLTDDIAYVEMCLAAHTKHFTALGMYSERGNPLPYDHFPRHYLAGILQKGYRGKMYSTYCDILWKGAWTSLFMQSPTGQLPTGYRSSHHIWNEAEQAVTFEIYASTCARAGMKSQAGAFKRAARLSLGSIKRWVRPDGSGYIVKNRYPIEARHGYESYSAHTCYNMLACSMLAQAWAFADDSIPERPSPADVGGFVIGVLKPFHKVFANASGNYVEYDTSGDHVYNPTGLLRVHLKGGHPQLGPSDGCAPKYSGKGVNVSVSPAWRDGGGRWRKLADVARAAPKLEILAESPRKVRFRLTYDLPPVRLAETITVDSEGVTVEDIVTGARGDTMRVYYPMLVFDGRDRTKVKISGASVKLTLAGKSVRFTILVPKDAKLRRAGKELKHRNGLVEPIIAEFKGNRATYRISVK
jgi:hypothetical protein